MLNWDLRKKGMETREIVAEKEVTPTQNNPFCFHHVPPNLQSTIWEEIYRKHKHLSHNNLPKLAKSNFTSTLAPTLSHCWGNQGLWFSHLRYWIIKTGPPLHAPGHFKGDFNKAQIGGVVAWSFIACNFSLGDNNQLTLNRIKRPKVLKY